MTVFWSVYSYMLVWSRQDAGKPQRSREKALTLVVEGFPVYIPGQSSLLHLPSPWNRGLHECMLSHFSCVQLCVTLWTVAHQAPLSVGFPRQGYWSGLPCPLPGVLPDPGIEPTSLTSPALAAGSLLLASPGKPRIHPVHCYYFCLNQSVIF